MGAEADDEDVELLRQAQEWQKADTEGDVETGKAFAVWLRTSSRHVEAYLRVSAMGHELAGLDRNREFDLQRLRSVVKSQLD
jgi:ferric-dicitrate binding protein FerR (iron transport regulator)